VDHHIPFGLASREFPISALCGCGIAGKQANIKNDAMHEMLMCKRCKTVLARFYYAKRAILLITSKLFYLLTI
jgi:hypothetical protein